MKNKLVREAVAYAVNKNAIVQILGGKAIGSATSQLILPGNVGYIPNYNPFPDNNGAGDPAKAKQLLAQAHKTGVAVKLLYSTTDPMPRVAQALQSSLDAAGFKVSLVSATQSDFYGKYLENPSTGQARRLGHRAAGLDPRLVRQQRPLDHRAAADPAGPGLERLRRVHQRDGAEVHQRRPWRPPAPRRPTPPGSRPTRRP